MSLAAGTKLGPYEILAPIGTGGMGEVYRARDTRLKRDVALKVLPEAFANDPNRMMRFQREAEVLASLSHPNIAHIFGVEDRALAMELVEGESPRGPMPYDEAWKVALQIADALAYAHEKGVVHRDLKPANIKVTPDGVVKLLDFGLAKAFSGTPDSISADPGNSPTITMGATAVGVILGTAAYMSPEQARGKNVDRRADIWAFGVVLYELLTGKQLFRGEDLTDILASVVKEHPDLSAAPEPARRVLQACLEKDPKKRLQAIGDVQYLVGGTDAPAATAPTRSRSSAAGWVAAAVLAIAAAAVSLVHFREAPPPEDPLKLSVTLPADGLPGYLALSPDGRRLVVTMIVQRKNGLYVRALDSSEFHLLEGTEAARTPFWSPDSRFIGFFADGKFKVIPAAGGPAVTLCGETGLGGGGTWNRAGIILLGTEDRRLLRVSASGGKCSPVKLGDENFRGAFPEFLPDGNHFLLAGGDRTDPSTNGLYLSALDGMKPRKILNDFSSALYSPPASGKGPAHLLFLRGSNLMAQPFDPDKLESIGDPFPVVAQASVSLTSPQVFASVAPNGTLVYVGNRARELQLTWFDRSGKELGKVGDPGNRTGVSLSPDGDRAFIDERSVTNPLPNLGLLDLARNSESRFTPAGKAEGGAVWSPDGTRVIYSSADGPNLNLFLKSADGGGPETPLLPPGMNGRTASDWSRDGRFLIYTEIDAKTQGDIWYLPDPGNPGSKPVKFLATDASESQGQLSPDGRWLAYWSDEGGNPGSVYVRSFPAGDRPVKIADKASEPRWSKSGNELFYLARSERPNVAALNVVPFQAAAAGPPRLGAAQKIVEFQARTFVPQGNAFAYSPHPDGKRFLVNVNVESRPELDVITNWQKLAEGSR
jgi:Tol biopolymer transport system component